MLTTSFFFFNMASMTSAISQRENLYDMNIFWQRFMNPLRFDDENVYETI